MDIGKKLRNLRTKNGLTQEELASRTELSKGFISQLENDVTSPSIATLSDLLLCLGTDLKSFFDEGKILHPVFRADDFFEKTDEDCHTVTKWIVPDAQKNRMEPILLTVHEKGATAPESPHEGEEFGFLIRGSIYLHLGSDRYRVHRGEAFYFIPDTPHYISNAGKEDAILLWISTPPNF